MVCENIDNSVMRWKIMQETLSPTWHPEKIKQKAQSEKMGMGKEESRGRPAGVGDSFGIQIEG